MSPKPSNIESVARDICARLYSKHWPPGPEMNADIDRHWHIVAAQLEAGLIAEDGTDIVPPDIDRERAAVRDWLERHPDHVTLPRSLR
jgi:hypothetical protein